MIALPCLDWAGRNDIPYHLHALYIYPICMINPNRFRSHDSAACVKVMFMTIKFIETMGETRNKVFQWQMVEFGIPARKFAQTFNQKSKWKYNKPNQKKKLLYFYSAKLSAHSTLKESRDIQSAVALRAQKLWNGWFGSDKSVDQRRHAFHSECHAMRRKWNSGDANRELLNRDNKIKYESEHSEMRDNGWPCSLSHISLLALPHSFVLYLSNAYAH